VDPFKLLQLRDARNLAMRRLSIRDYASLEMLAYLKSRKFPPDISTEVVQQLVDEKLLDDRRYARAVTRTQSIRDKGPGYILGKLKQKGVVIELDEVRTLFAEHSNMSELELARKLLERRYPRALAEEKDRKRAYGALLRRGFSAEIARECLLEKNPTPTPIDDE
jgi:SOS response regulatory protein OraA/RecX